MVTLQEMPEAVTSFLTKHQLINAAAYADEQPAGVQRALGPVVALVLRGFAELAGQAEGRDTVWNAAREAATASPGSATTGTGLMKTVLDDRYHGTVSTVAKEAGVSTPTVSSLLDAATTAALSIMGGLVAEQHWTAQQLGDWLRPRQYAPVAAPLPAVAAAPVASASASWFAAPANVLLLVVSVIAAAEFGYILSTRSSAPPETVAAASAPATTAPAASQYTAIPVANISAPRAKVAVPVVLKLKDGVRQIIGANSTESKLYQFLIDPAKEIDEVDPTKGWIGFDRIYFDTNKATLTNESLWQLSNVASILKRFPAAKIKIGGYTDASGNAFSNLKLSTARAKAAKDALVSLGVPADRLTAAGYGIVDNIASNDTEEGRALNRRVSLQVTQK